MLPLDEAENLLYSGFLADTSRACSPPMLHIPSVLTLTAPASKQALPLIVDSPHSGRDYPADFRTLAPRALLERAEDRHVDWLFEGSPRCGAYFLQAHFPRSYIDPNRAEDDLDLALLHFAEGDAEGDAGRRLSPSAKTKQGYGLIWRYCPPGLPLYDRKLLQAEVRARQENYWQPYHRALKRLYDRLQGEFGCVFHLNVHSMPAAAVGRGGADVVLGDRKGNSCSTAWLQCLQNAFEREGFSVAVNDPYQGAHLITAYANKRARREALQVEINRALYLDETNAVLKPEAREVRVRLEAVLACASAYVANLIEGPAKRYARRCAHDYAPARAAL